MKRQRTLAEGWLWLGVIAVATAGLYALVPVFARTPQFVALGFDQRLFDVALVIHVDLSVLVWFFAMICMGASLMMERHAHRFPYWGKAGFGCVALATVLMAFSPLGAWVPVKSNYIPVLHNGMFLTSLGLLTAGLIVTLIPFIVTYLQPRYFRALQALELAWVAAGLVVLFGLVGYAVGAQHVPEGIELKEHYEMMFWTGGHMMQFAFTLLVMAAWLSLLQVLGSALPHRRLSLLIYDVTAIGAVLSLYAAVSTHDGDFVEGQTRIMIEWGAIGATAMGLVVVRSLWMAARRPSPEKALTRNPSRGISTSPKGEVSQRQLLDTGEEAGRNLSLGRGLNFPLEKIQGEGGFQKSTRAYAAALIVSLVLFFFGGVLGLMIQGQNVTIPAHYHGMITGITQALMGLAYLMLPRFGYQPVAQTRLAFWQPIIYGIGQLMHIGGLAYCGGYGVLRKTAGGFAELAPNIKIALGIFGLGGLLAIAGGVLFVIVMLRARRA